MARTRIERYWSLAVNRYSDLRNSSYWEQVEVLNDALVESVRLQMVSDVPLGAFLSGGVNSSVLVAMMTREAGHRIRNLSVGFEAEGAAIDESQDALRTARYLGTDHNRVLVRGQDVSDRNPSHCCLARPTLGRRCKFIFCFHGGSPGSHCRNIRNRGR